MSDQNTMSLIHQLVAEELTKRIKSGEATTADLNAAIKFLKDNNINAVPEENTSLINLSTSFPTFDEDEEERYNLN